eukprot:gene6441-6939_t
MSNIINNQYLNLSNQMAHCVVMKKNGMCIAYELYEEATNQFIMSCVACPQLTPMILFVRIQDCHLRNFEDLCCNLNIKYYLGRMMSDWMTGYNYTLTGFNGEVLCEIRYSSKYFVDSDLKFFRVKAQLMTSAPIALSAKITNLDYEADDIAGEPFSNAKTRTNHIESQSSLFRAPPFCSRSSNSSSNLTFSDLFLSCFQESNLVCFEDATYELKANTKPTEADIERPEAFQQLSDSTYKTPNTCRETTMYTSLTDSNQNLQYTFISTKKPTWNSEINQWMHFFGGRVKIPSVHNFLAIEVPPSVDGFNGNSLVYQSAIQDQISERVCIRHGKVFYFF